MGSLKILSEMPEDKAEARSFFLEKEKWKTWQELQIRSGH